MRESRRIADESYMYVARMNVVRLQLPNEPSNEYSDQVRGPRVARVAVSEFSPPPRAIRQV